ncbi:hypothetical protein [Nocardia jiangsuensis]|uniref:Recombinase n=1 Tax=Nocardia jiangsuensis TaxID=1691563 RepID=A0ABV8DZP7_9NOCA
MTAPRIKRGRPRLRPDPVTLKITRTLYTQGLSYRAICAELTARQAATLSGGCVWRPPHLERLLRTDEAQALRLHPRTWKGPLIPPGPR